MTEYALYLESGPKRKKTMVHVPALLGCIASGPTTEAALEATPDAIRAYLRFLRRGGEETDPDAPFSVTVAEHLTEGVFIGNGSPYVTFRPDFDPVTEGELETFIARFHMLRETLAAWAESQSNEALDAAADGRTSRAILQHVLTTPGAYVATVASAPGVSRIGALCERGEMPLAEGLRQVESIVSRCLRETTPQQRSEAVQRGQMLRTLRKAIRRTLEHDWEHLVELSRRPGGPLL